MAVQQAALVSDESALEACLRRRAIQIDDLYLYLFTQGLHNAEQKLHNTPPRHAIHTPHISIIISMELMSESSAIHHYNCPHTQKKKKKKKIPHRPRSVAWELIPFTAL